MARSARCGDGYNCNRATDLCSHSQKPDSGQCDSRRSNQDDGSKVLRRLSPDPDTSITAGGPVTRCRAIAPPPSPHTEPASGPRSHRRRSPVARVVHQEAHPRLCRAEEAGQKVGRRMSDGEQHKWMKAHAAGTPVLGHHGPTWGVHAFGERAGPSTKESAPTTAATEQDGCCPA